MNTCAAAERPDIMRTVWTVLNDIETDELLGHGRVYGGGLHKLEPKELRGFPAMELIARLPKIERLQKQLKFLNCAA